MAISPTIARPAKLADASAIADIYNEGIADRIATFETRFREAEDVAAWFDSRHPIAVVEIDGVLVAFAATSTYRPRDCYRGVAEVSVYVRRSFRGKGYGALVMRQLFVTAGKAGFWKLVSRVFPENEASRRLLLATGFREVGIYKNHAQLEGTWRDVVIVEKLLGT